jgi:hypothetical protein
MIAQSMKAQLKSVGVEYIGCFEGKNSCTSFLSILVIFIFRVHLLFVKDTELFLERPTIQSQQSRKQLGFNLEG